MRGLGKVQVKSYSYGCSVCASWLASYDYASLRRCWYKSRPSSAKSTAVCSSRHRYVISQAYGRWLVVRTGEDRP